MSDVLLGREREVARIAQLLDEARAGRSAALLFSGEAGIGKTALCDEAASLAEDMTVLRARGMESESELAFSGLADLFAPLAHLHVRLPESQASALAGAFAIGPPVLADPFTIGVATLSLLAEAAEDRPVLGLVDDLQWLDGSSRRALLFAARRLRAEGVALLLAARLDEGYDDNPDTEVIERLELSGLSLEASAELLRATSDVVVDPDVVQALHDATAGNALALVEFPRLLRATQLGGQEPLEDPLPLGPTVERAFRRRVAQLPTATRTALLVAAASGDGDAATVMAALRRLGVADTAFEPAEASEIVRIEGAKIEFRHPLLRSAAYHAALAPQRRRGHAALAEALQEDASGRQAWHLAAAALAPDEQIAAALTAAALASRVRGGHASAGRAMIRAAQLTPDAHTRARRYGEASTDVHLAGGTGRAVELVNLALSQVQRDDDVAAELRYGLGILEMLRGRLSEAHAILVAEAERLEATDPGRAAALLTNAVGPCYLAGDGLTGYRTAHRAHTVAQRVGGLALSLAEAVLGQALVIRGDADQGVALLKRCLPALLNSDPLWGQHVPAVHSISLSFVWIEEHDIAQRLLERTIHAARAASAPGMIPFPLAVLAELQLRSGNWDRAAATGHEALTLALETGQAIHVPGCLVGLARLEALQGRSSECRSHLAEARHQAETLGVSRYPQLDTEEVLGILAFGEEDPVQALEHLEPLAAYLSDQEVGEPTLLGSAPERIESLLRVGRVDEAQEALAAFEHTARVTKRTWALGAAGRCRGLLSDASLVDDLFQEALSWHENSPVVYERARTELCYGEQLRRHRRRTDARHWLHTALETFDHLGAIRCAERARSELAATGERTTRPRTSASRELTPQELQVATIVTEGATNREAAAALFLSPKTVEYHLSSIYRKLNVRTRTELARKLS